MSAERELFRVITTNGKDHLAFVQVYISRRLLVGEEVAKPHQVGDGELQHCWWQKAATGTWQRSSILLKGGFKNKSRNWWDPERELHCGRAEDLGCLTPFRFRSLALAISEGRPYSFSDVKFLISSCMEVCWLRVWAQTASSMSPLYFRGFCQPNCSWGVTLSLGIRPFVAVPCKELRED